jgi:hypothetical protein
MLAKAASSCVTWSVAGAASKRVYLIAILLPGSLTHLQRCEP